jgi:aspartyl-tRNA(Asn)/glutamyl-tRNA(Gln) amidotransferase subunit B
LNFDAETGNTSPLRSKEMANDYRYFPEPDLQPLVLEQKYITNLAAELPELPSKKIERYTTVFGLSEYDAILLSSEQEIANYFDELSSITTHFKAAANWVIGPLRTYLHDNHKPITAFPLKPEQLSDLISLIDQGKLNYSVAANQVFPELIKNPGLTAEKVASSMQLLIDTEGDELSLLVDEILNSYPDKVKEYQNGKKGVLGLFMGDLMKKTKGKINPQLASKLIIDKLESKA